MNRNCISPEQNKACLFARSFHKNALRILLACALLAACNRPPHYHWPLPPEFPAPPIPKENPMTVEKVTLGRHLFYDKRLSANQQQACADCHQQTYAFSDNRIHAIGSTGQQHHRNSLALINIAYNSTLTWAHPELTEIERQLLIPMFGENPIELGISGHEQAILDRIQQDPTYQHLFTAAYPRQAQSIQFDNITKALACFVRSLLSFQSAFDRYAYYYDDTALNASELRGLKLFMSERLECHHCHGGFNFTQSTTHLGSDILEKPFHNTGLYNLDGEGAYPNNDRGLYDITGDPKHMGHYRAPTLRNISHTAPYMHDGSLPTLTAVIDFYAAGGRNLTHGEHAGDGRQNPHKNPFIKGFTLDEQERQDLLNFLQSLTDHHFIANPDYSNPWQRHSHEFTATKK